MLKCPECGNDQQKLFIGHEIRGVYDGVLVWQCTKCGHAWPRWTEGYRGEQAKGYADELNAHGGNNA